MSAPEVKRVKLETLSNGNGSKVVIQDNEDIDGSGSEEEEYEANGKPATGDPRLLFFFRRSKPKRDTLGVFNDAPHETTLDMKKYKPEDISIKIIKLNTVIITAKGRDGVEDFEKTIKLSDYYNTDLLKATYTADRNLTIQVPTIVSKRPIERNVPFFNNYHPSTNN